MLNNTGSSGGLTVTGDGSTTGGLLDRDGSGGTIQNTSGDAVSLTNAFNVTLRQMNITNAGWDGVDSRGGGNIVLSAVDINHPGDDNPASNGSTGNAAGFGGGNGWYAENITGTNAFDNSVTVERNNFHDADETSGDGNNTLFLALAGSGDLNFTINDNDFTNLALLNTLAGIVQVNAAGGTGTSAAGAQLNGTISNNTITNTDFVSGRRGIMVAAEASAGDHGGHTVAITGNSVQGLDTQGIYVSLTSVGGFDVLNNNITISNNQVGTTIAVGQDGGDGGSAIEFETNIDADGTGGQISGNVLIQGNTAVSNNNSGIGDTLEIANRSGNNTGAGNSSTLNLTILGNNLTQQNAGGDVFQISNSIMTTTTVNVDLNSDNILANRNTFTGGDADGVLLRNDAGTFRIEDLVGGAEAFVEARNNGNVTVTGTIVATGDVPLPTNPSFLEAASGGVDAMPPADATTPTDSVPQDDATNPPADTAPPVEADPQPLPVDDTAPVETDPDPAPVTETDAQTPPPADTPIVDDGVLTQAELDYFVDAAIARWSEAGLTDDQLDALEAMTLRRRRHVGAQSRRVLADADHARYRRRRPRLVPRRHAARRRRVRHRLLRHLHADRARPARRPGTTTSSPPSCTRWATRSASGTPMPRATATS